MLIDKYKALTNQASPVIPKAVKDYYISLSKFTWDCVARTIPMILSTDEQRFNGEIHESLDGGGDSDSESGDDSNKGKLVSYMYPVLFTSTNWPREIALKAKVKIIESQDTVV